VAEAKDGEPLLPGTAVLAQAGRHLVLRRSADGKLITQLPIAPFDKLHRPSADVLFESAAETLGSRVLGVVMTGMGEDGKQGAAWIKAQGGTILTESRSSCVIYGMPRAIEEAGLSDRSVHLDQLAAVIINSL
jgi:two-component system chemotaxis response regulator CheB